MPALNRIQGTRIASTPAAIEAAQFPAGSLMLRFAADEVFVTSAVAANAISDLHAIVEPDASFVGVWLNAAQANDLLAHHCEWELPQHRPAFAQGAVAGLAMKLWFEAERVLLLVPAPYETDLEALLMC